MRHRSQIDALLPKADEALNKAGIEIVKVGHVEDGYDSAIAAFGPTVVVSGLIPALAFYCTEKKHESSKTDKKKVINAIAHTLHAKYAWNDYKALFNHCLRPENSQDDIEKLTMDIVDASVALKMMVRTYKITETHEQQ